jgi:hypothetical protein
LKVCPAIETRKGWKYISIIPKEKRPVLPLPLGGEETEQLALGIGYWSG